MQTLSGGLFQSLKSFGLIALNVLNFAGNTEEKKSNVIFILTDQWRAGYLGKVHLEWHGRKSNFIKFNQL